MCVYVLSPHFSEAVGCTGGDLEDGVLVAGVAGVAVRSYDGQWPGCGPSPLLGFAARCITGRPLRLMQLRDEQLGLGGGGHVRQGRAGPQGCAGQLQGYGLRRHYATLRHYAALRVPALEMQRADRGFALKNTS